MNHKLVETFHVVIECKTAVYFVKCLVHMRTAFTLVDPKSIKRH